MLQALDDLPAEYSQHLDNVIFSVSRAPTRRESRRLGLRSSALYGLYEGIPLTHRGGSYDRVVPDRITIFWGPLLRDFPDETSLAEEVRKTLYHEIAHYFGLEEDDLHQTSVR